MRRCKKNKPCPNFIVHQGQLSGNVSLSVWILETGFWNNDGVWKNTSFWNNG